MLLEKTLGELLAPILHVQLGTIFFGTLNILVTLTMIYIGYLVILAMYMKLVKFRKELKELRELKDHIGEMKPFSSMQEHMNDSIRNEMHTLVQEEIEKVSKENDKVSTEEIKGLMHKVAKQDIKHKEKVKQTISPSVQDKIDKIRADRKLNVSNEAGTIPKKKARQGIIPSNDREQYPEIFKELYTLTDILVGMIGMTALAKKLGGTPAMIQSFKKKEIATKKTAMKHITNMKKVLAELQDSEKKKSMEEVIEDTYGLASQEAIDNMYKLYEIAHEHGMSQAEIGLRLEVSQPVVSAIANKQIAKANQVTEYTHKLETLTNRLN